MDFHLLGKTELVIHNIHLNNANLDEIAGSVASVLSLATRDVAVIDVRPGTVAIDILRTAVKVEQIASKSEEILQGLQTVRGVLVTEATTIDSEGILGLVGLSRERLAEFESNLDSLGRQIGDAIRLRAIVFPTGDEIIKGEIEDTNTAFLTSLLTGLGYRVTRGSPLADSREDVLGALGRAADDGFGLVLTTGGVGAEDKDHLVDAIATLAPGASTPYVVHYSRGHWRHEKDGVRLAVGSRDLTRFVALPGPHPEVRLLAPVLARGLREQWSDAALAEELAATLRQRLVPAHSASG